MRLGGGVWMAPVRIAKNDVDRIDADTDNTESVLPPTDDRWPRTMSVCANGVC